MRLYSVSRAAKRRQLFRNSLVAIPIGLVVSYYTWYPMIKERAEARTHPTKQSQQGNVCIVLQSLTI